MGLKWGQHLEKAVGCVAFVLDMLEFNYKVCCQWVQWLFYKVNQEILRLTCNILLIIVRIGSIGYRQVTDYILYSNQ